MTIWPQEIEMVTTMAAPKDHHTEWDALADDLNTQIGYIKTKEAELLEAKRGLRVLMEKMFGENGPQSIPTHINLPTKTSIRSSISSQPRESRAGSKRDFVEQMFLKNPNVSPAEIQEAWVKEGHEDTISNSLVYKTKGDLVASGQIRSERKRGRPRKSESSKTISQKIETEKKPLLPDSDIHQMVRDFAFEILCKEPEGLTIAEIVEIMENESLVPNLPEGEYIGNIVSVEMKSLRDSGKVERGENKVLRRVKGATLD